MEIARKGYQLLIMAGEMLQPVLLLAVRLIWGWQFFVAGQGKLANHEKTARFFASLNIPMPDFNAWFVGGVECFGGLLLLAGFSSRPVALVLIGNMIVAYLTAHPEEVAALLQLNPGPFAKASPFAYLLTAVIVFAFGPGKFSVDALLASKCCPSRDRDDKAPPGTPPPAQES